MSANEFIVRTGKRSDSSAAARLWVMSAEEHTTYDTVYTTAPGAEKTMRSFLDELANSGFSRLFVAEIDSEIVGFASGELREGSPAFDARTWASVEDVFVLPEFRSLGIGRALLAACREWAMDKSANGITLQVAARNARARKFYEELGFREISVYQILEF